MPAQLLAQSRPVHDPSAQLQQHIPTQAHGQAFGQSLQQHVPNAGVAAGFSANFMNAIMASQTPLPSTNGLSAPRGCSKCRKNGNVAWNTRLRDNTNPQRGRKTFATCNHCQWSPGYNRREHTAVGWVRLNAPWLIDDQGVYCPCYWGDVGDHAPHPMCFPRRRAGPDGPAPVPVAPGPVAPAAPVAFMAPDSAEDDGDPDLFVQRHE
ncbi:hypothetical protein CSAL01_00348 [Colletotrichum salicis]|uniref:Uncharacterized protein n=1 Tax=Colletotrichum salicis TaxID=1209931 RepID=A0A135RSX4_9PEZI|nr:hypothetical protein CSAL01_00348 [Colletotrichum salicis]